VWEILGHRFADIGRWATAIDDSRPAVGETVLGDLKHYAEHGTPSPRKQRRLVAGS
jgi:hypothetical protein